MNEETVRHWIRKADNDPKIGKDEMATQDPVVDMVCFHMRVCNTSGGFRGKKGYKRRSGRGTACRAPTAGANA